MASTAVIVKTEIYEGPLDLLLELIEKRKLLINDLSLATVTDEYIAQLNRMEGLPVEETAQFVSLAATLLLIKSRSLLPLISLSEEETRDIKELEYRLALYQLVKEAARELFKHMESTSMLQEGIPPETPPQFLPDQSITIGKLHEGVLRLIEGFPKIETLPSVAVQKILSIEEVVESLSQRISGAMRLSFREVSKNSETDLKLVRHDLIVHFLALLELVKQGIIKATQEGNGDITLEPDSMSTPSYE